MQPHPDAEFAQCAREIEKFCAHLAVAPFARRVFKVDAIGRRVLGDHQQFFHAGRNEPLRLAQHIGRRP